MNRRKTEPARGVLSTAVADPQRYQHARYHPSPDLAPYVEHFWSVTWNLRGQPPERAETLPHPSVHMIFERNVGGRINGILRKRFSRVLDGEGGVMSVKFTPGGFYPFVGRPMSKLTDITLSVHDVFGADGDELERAIFAAVDDASRIATLEAFLRARRPAPDETAATITRMVYAVAEDRGILSVDDLVTGSGMNKRTLQRLFAKYVGVSPKWVIQRYRLHEAAERLTSQPSIAQAALATDLGYSDQAHFIRDFKALVGTSPAAYARAARGRRDRV